MGAEALLVQAWLCGKGTGGTLSTARPHRRRDVFKKGPGMQDRSHSAKRHLQEDMALPVSTCGRGDCAWGVGDEVMGRRLENGCYRGKASQQWSSEVQ